MTYLLEKGEYEPSNAKVLVKIKEVDKNDDLMPYKTSIYINNVCVHEEDWYDKEFLEEIMSSDEKFKQKIIEDLDKQIGKLEKKRFKLTGEVKSSEKQIYKLNEELYPNQIVIIEKTGNKVVCVKADGDTSWYVNEVFDWDDLEEEEWIKIS